MKRKILLLVLILILFSSCSITDVNNDVDNGGEDNIVKDLTPLVSCLGHNPDAYKALGTLAEPNVQGEITKYDLPANKGYYSGFDLRIWNQDNTVKALYLKPQEQDIKIRDITIPIEEQELVEYFDSQNAEPISSAFGMSQNNIQFYDDEYLYIFYLDDDFVNAVEITTLEAYQEYILVKSETINGEVLDYSIIDNLIVENYDGKLNSILDTYYFDCNSGSNAYFITLIGRFNKVEFLYGKRESEAYILLEADILEDSHIVLGGAPKIEDNYLLAIRFRNALGETKQVELNGDNNEILYKDQISTREKHIGGQILLDRVTTYDNNGHEVDFVITKDDKKIDNSNYLYVEINEDLELLATENISNSQPKNGCITNPQVIDDRMVSYTVTNTNDECAPGLSYITKVIDLNTMRTEVFCDCSISFVLDELYEPYINYIIARKFEVNNEIIAQKYYLFSPEGVKIASLGNYLEPFYLLEQIEEAVGE